MKIDQVAIQLYTLRDHLKTPEQVADTLDKVASIGYPAVQISGMSEDVMTSEAMAQLCADKNLTICATHESSEEILKNPDKVVQRLKALGCTLTAYPFPGGIDFGSEESVTGLISALNKSGQVLADAGQILTYHNHHHEFRKLGGQIILDRIYAETDPCYVQGEIDTYWIQFGGGDPVAWCKKLAGRLPMIHLKDYMINSDAQVMFSEIGAGVLDFPAIIAAAEESGCQWFIVEQDTCPGDPFESIAQSFDYIAKHLVS